MVKQFTYRVGALTCLAVLTFTSLVSGPAHADFAIYRNAPTAGACWNKVNAYGGVYQVTSVMVNDSPSAHLVDLTVERPGVGVTEHVQQNVASGAWVQFPIANVALVTGDVWTYTIDGAQLVRLPASAMPYYMQNCAVKTSPSANVRTALSYGLARLDAYYTGCNAGSYRMGATASSTLYFNGSSCHQHNYVLPAGAMGFDCSGLVYKMMQAAGVYFPYTSSSAMAALPARNGPAQVGDLLVYPGHHVAVFLGDGDGDGVPSVLEASPKQILQTVTHNGASYRYADGVLISPATSYYNAATGTGINGYVVRYVPGL